MSNAVPVRAPQSTDVSALLLLVLVDSNNTIMILLSCLPVGVTGLLVIPIPNYHNVRVAIMSIYRFFTGRRRYIWKGWCFYERFAQESVAAKDAKSKF